MGEDLPADVYQQWRRWCRYPHYFFDDPEIGVEMRATFSRVRTTILAASATDDRWSPPQSRDAFLVGYENAQVVTRDFDPAAMATGPLGHMGLFRQLEPRNPTESARPRELSHLGCEIHYPEEPMKLAGFALALGFGASSLAAQAAPRVATTLTGTELSALETVRKAVWIDWFSGDTLALSRVLSPELVAMSAGAPDWQSLRQTMTSSADFSAKGGKLIAVAFDSALTHRFGDVVVMFSQYTVVTENADKRSTQKGRATEVFVRTHGRWVHTSWHLDRST